MQTALQWKALWSIWHLLTKWCCLLTSNSAKPAFQEGKFKIQKLLTNTFFLLPSPALYNIKCTELQVVIVNEKWFPTSSIHFPTSHPTSNPLPPMHPLTRHPLLLPYSFCNVPHKTSQSVCCLIPWIRAELRLNTLKTASGKSHLYWGMLPGTSCRSGNPLGSFSPTDS